MKRIQNVGGEPVHVEPHVTLEPASKLLRAPMREPVTALMKKVVAAITSEYLPHLEGFRVSLAVVDIVVIPDQVQVTEHINPVIREISGIPHAIGQLFGRGMYDGAGQQ